MDDYRFRFETDGDVTRIFVRSKGEPLTILVDTTDLPRLRGYGLSMARGYVRVYRNGEPPRRLHRFITDAPDGLEVDHVERNKLDNRRAKLALRTGRDNRRQGWGRYFGWDRKRGAYRVQIWWSHRPHVFGWYAEPRDAERAAASARSRLLAGEDPAAVKLAVCGGSGPPKAG
jgi:hypothetical protein